MRILAFIYSSFFLDRGTQIDRDGDDTEQLVENLTRLSTVYAANLWT